MTTYFWYTTLGIKISPGVYPEALEGVDRTHDG